jgi:hypothetical protein
MRQYFQNSFFKDLIYSFLAFQNECFVSYINSARNSQNSGFDLLVSVAPAQEAR